MKNIFISYSHQDYCKAEDIAAALQRMGWSIWWDKRLAAGEEFREEIKKALKEVHCVVVIWSKNSATSSWVKYEASAANDMNKLVPLQIDTGPLPHPFSEMHTPKLDGWSGDLNHFEWQSICRGVEHFAGPAQNSEKTICRFEAKKRLFDRMKSVDIDRKIGDAIPNLKKSICGVILNAYQGVVCDTIDAWKNGSTRTPKITSLPSYAETELSTALRASLVKQEISKCIFQCALEIAVETRLTTATTPAVADEGPLDVTVIQTPGHHGILDASWVSGDAALYNIFEKVFESIADDWIEAARTTMRSAAGLKASAPLLASLPFLGPALPGIVAGLTIGGAIIAGPAVAYRKTKMGRSAINAGLFRIELPLELRKAAEISLSDIEYRVAEAYPIVERRISEKDVIRLTSQLSNAVADITLSD